MEACNAMWIIFIPDSKNSTTIRGYNDNNRSRVFSAT